MSAQIIHSYQVANNASMAAAEAYFFNLWANATTPTGNPSVDAMLLSLNGKPTGISLTAAKKLFDSNFPYALTETVNNNVSWSIAKYWSSLVPGNSSNVENWFGLTTDQVQSIALWLLSPRFTYAIIDIIHK